MISFQVGTAYIEKSSLHQEVSTLIIESIEWVAVPANGHSDTLRQMEEPCSDDTRRMALGVAV